MTYDARDTACRPDLVPEFLAPPERVMVAADAADETAATVDPDRTA